MDARSVSRNFKAFAEPTRLKILACLSAKEMTVNELVRAVRLAQPTVSRHLAMLRDNGFVADRREGQQVFYRLRMEKIKSCCDGFCSCLMIAPSDGGMTEEADIE
jgi:ArsR family transcriptional regulator